jgi:hypothetical protein
MANSTPHRRSVFAVWRWRWWAWGVIVPGLCVSYLLASPVAYYMFDGRGAIYFPPFLHGRSSKGGAVKVSGTFSAVVDRLRWVKDGLDLNIGS